MFGSISKSKIVALIMATAFFMQNLDGTIVATALPKIADSFHTSPVALSSVITCYLLSVAVFLPISGWAADRWGASNVFRVAIVIFTIGSALCGISTSVVQLDIARVLQGIGGAMMVPVGRLVVLRSVSRAEFVEVMTYLLVPGQLGQVLGPPVGGWITTYASWRWAFLVNLPMGVAGIYFATRYIDIQETLLKKPLDWIGFLATGFCLSALLYGAQSFTEDHPEVVLGTSALALGLASGFFAVKYSLRHSNPLIDFNLLRIPTFFANFVSGMPFRLSYGASVILLPFTLQLGMGLTAFMAGMMIFASAVGNVAIKLASRPVLKRRGFRTVMIVNGALAAVITMLCGLFEPGTAIYVILPVVVFLGFAQSMQFTCLNTLCYADVSQARMSGATSLGQMGNQIANAFGATLAALILKGLPVVTHRTEFAPLDFRLAFVVAGAIGLATVPLLWTLPRNAGEELSGNRLPDMLPRSHREEPSLAD